MWFSVVCTVIDHCTRHYSNHCDDDYNIKDNERNLCRNFPYSNLKVHALHYANDLLVRVRLSFQKLCKLAQNTETIRKIALIRIKKPSPALCKHPGEERRKLLNRSGRRLA